MPQTASYSKKQKTTSYRGWRLRKDGAAVIHRGAFPFSCHKTVAKWETWRSPPISTAITIQIVRYLYQSSDLIGAPPFSYTRRQRSGIWSIRRWISNWDILCHSACNSAGLPASVGGMFKRAGCAIFFVPPWCKTPPNAKHSGNHSTTMGYLTKVGEGPHQNGLRISPIPWPSHCTDLRDESWHIYQIVQNSFM